MNFWGTVVHIFICMYHKSFLCSYGHATVDILEVGMVLPIYQHKFLNKFE